MEPQTYLLLHCDRLKSHTDEHIHETTEWILDRFNIKEKIYTILTDNASSIIKADQCGLSVDDEINVDNNEVQWTTNSNIILIVSSLSLSE